MPRVIYSYRASIIAGACVAGAAYTTYRLVNYVHECDRKSDREFYERFHYQKLFQQTEEIRQRAILGTADELLSYIWRQCSTRSAEQQISLNPPNAQRLCFRVIVEIYTRIATYIYGASMLATALRIQLAMLGGIEQREALDKSSARLPTAVKQEFLWLLDSFLKERPMKHFVQSMRRRVRLVLVNYPLHQRLSITRLEMMFLELERSIRGDLNDASARMIHYLLRAHLAAREEHRHLLRVLYLDMHVWLDRPQAVNLHAMNIRVGFEIGLQAAINCMSIALSNFPNLGNEEPTSIGDDDDSSDRDSYEEEDSLYENSYEESSYTENSSDEGESVADYDVFNDVVVPEENNDDSEDDDFELPEDETLAHVLRSPFTRLSRIDASEEHSELFIDGAGDPQTTDEEFDIIAVHMQCAYSAFDRIILDFSKFLSNGVNADLHSEISPFFYKVTQDSKKLSTAVFEEPRATYP